MRSVIAAVIAIGFAAAAHAQFGDLLKKIDPSKIKKGAKAVQQATHEFSDDEEADIGRVVAARVLATYPLSKSEKLQKYVTLVGNTVAAYSARPALDWHFAVIDSDIVNAFAAPGGFVFITIGALKQMKSEAELASVLGHEISHVTQKHILKEVKRGNVISAGVEVAKETSAGSYLSDDVGRRISNLAIEKLFKSGLSRDDEQEADSLGTQVAAAAGYKSTEFLEFLDHLRHLESSSQMRMLISTHPTPEARIRYLKPRLKSDEGVTLAERWDEWTQPLTR